jgi:hypothetical protein
MAIDEELRHRARRREHVCGSISRFCIRGIKEIVGAEWNLLELGELSHSKVIELNQDTSFNMFSLCAPTSRTMEVCRLYSLTLLPYLREVTGSNRWRSFP